MKLQSMIDELEKEGYLKQDAIAKTAQDIILKAISESSFSEKVTIKGGIVMRNISGNSRRTTQDIDLDFMRYSISENNIDSFIEKINKVPDIKIERIGSITELNQQDYQGKSVRIKITDKEGTFIESKIDIGVHKHLDIDQEKFCFDIYREKKGVSLFANSLEQIFTEKICSLLRFGQFNTRYKDIFDIYYCCDKVDNKKIMECFNVYIFRNKDMKERSIVEVIRRLENTFKNKQYRERVDKSDKRWLDTEIDEVLETIINYLKNLMD